MMMMLVMMIIIIITTTTTTLTNILLIISEISIRLYSSHTIYLKERKKLLIIYVMLNMGDNKKLKAISNNNRVPQLRS